MESTPEPMETHLTGSPGAGSGAVFELTYCCKDVTSVQNFLPVNESFLMESQRVFDLSTNRHQAEDTWYRLGGTVGSNTYLISSKNKEFKPEFIT